MSKIDARTKTMSAVALACRTLGHMPVLVPVPAADRLAYRDKGQRMLRILCARRINDQGCGRWREIILDIDTDEVISERGDYTNKDQYLVQAKGTGRLPRRAARGAFFKVVGEPKQTRPRRTKDKQ